jgi:hypothetical protein
MRCGKVFVGIIFIVAAIFLNAAMVGAKEPIKLGVAFAFQGVWSDWCKRNVTCS